MVNCRSSWNGSKKSQRRGVEARRAEVEPEHGRLSIARQCMLLGLNRSSFYYEPEPVDALDLELQRQLDELYTRCPFYGSRRMTVSLQLRGYDVNRKRIVRLMREMGLEAIYPKRKLSQGVERSKKYPYLLRGLRIGGPNEVWSTDITYVRMAKGFVYLVAVIDWFSRYVLSWRLSTTLDTLFCIEALEHALSGAKPQIFNTDQGAQFTSEAYVKRLEQDGVRVSWDGRGRALDNIFVERLWRSVKYEEVYLHDYETVPQAFEGLGRYFGFYNHERPHQALAYRTPFQVHHGLG